jgi:predicted aspartyl protease
MPHFSLTFTQGAPIVNMIVGVSGARYQALTAAGQAIPPLQNVRALVDTGASGTCIDPLVFQALGLQPTGSIPVLTPSTGSTPVDADTYDVAISIPNGNLPALVIHNMPVTASELFVAQGFHALLGRDILQQCVLTYNGSIGLFTFAY